jgi:hypothetical protein
LASLRCIADGIRQFTLQHVLIDRLAGDPQFNMWEAVRFLMVKRFEQTSDIGLVAIRRVDLHVFLFISNMLLIAGTLGQRFLLNSLKILSIGYPVC